jgi:hypothetical protein
VRVAARVASFRNDFVPAALAFYFTAYIVRALLTVVAAIAVL